MRVTTVKPPGLRSIGAALLALAVVLAGAAPAWAAEKPKPTSAAAATAGLLPDYLRLDLDLAGQSTGEFPGKLEVLRLPLRLHLGYEPGKPLRQFWFSLPRAAEAAFPDDAGKRNEVETYMKTYNDALVAFYRVRIDGTIGSRDP